VTLKLIYIQIKVELLTITVYLKCKFRTFFLYYNLLNNTWFVQRPKTPNEAWWRLSCYVLYIDEWGKKMQSAFYYRFSSPFTGYLPLSRHFIFIITLFISIITFLTKVCHHHHHHHHQWSWLRISCFSTPLVQFRTF
jgi:hypothetical protein